MEFRVCILNSLYLDRIAYSLEAMFTPTFLNTWKIFMILQMEYHRLMHWPKTSYKQRDYLWVLKSIDVSFRVHESYTLRLPKFKTFIAKLIFFFSYKVFEKVRIIYFILTFSEWPHFGLASEKNKTSCRDKM